MSRGDHRRRNASESAELNLAPFMNIVTILIPMLVLSAVFLKVGVVNVSNPNLASTETKTDADPGDSLDLTVAISREGFEISTSKRTYQAIDGCPESGPTVCLARSEIDVGAKLEDLERAMDSGDGERVGEELESLVSAYDFAQLYNELRAIKSEHGDADSFRITASPKVPYELVIRLIDAVRYELEQKRYSSNEQFWKATPVEGAEGEPVQLFGKPVLAIAR